MATNKIPANVAPGINPQGWSSTSTPGIKPDSPQGTLIYTYFTEAGKTKLLYSCSSWVTMRLRLEDAGPVAVGTRENLSPTLSGAGALLPAGGTDWMTFSLNRGDRLYIQADGINRVAVVVEPIPFGMEIVNRLSAVFEVLSGFGRK